MKVQSPKRNAIASFIKTYGLSPEILWHWYSASDTIGHPGYFIQSWKLTKSILKTKDTEQPPVEIYNKTMVTKTFPPFNTGNELLTLSYFRNEIEPGISPTKFINMKLRDKQMHFRN